MAITGIFRERELESLMEARGQVEHLHLHQHHNHQDHHKHHQDGLSIVKSEKLLAGDRGGGGGEGGGGDDEKVKLIFVIFVKTYFSYL